MSKTNNSLKPVARRQHYRLSEKQILVLILTLTMALYTIGMLRNQFANSFYAAAVQAGTVSWKALFFGSLDGANFITVDKPPVMLWVMGIFCRIFGFHAWSMLLPDVLAAIATVYMVYVMVHRYFGSTCALIAAGVMALTPIAVVMAGFNNPDTILTLLLTASTYAFLKALEGIRPVHWLTLTGVLSGLAFNTKMVQGLFLLPIFFVIYIAFAKPKLVTKLKHITLALPATLASTLWWSIIVSLIPAASRPYIGSSYNNSIWNLFVGYNGIGRFLGDSKGQPHLGSIGSGGPVSIFRIFNDEFGPNIGWFIPLGLVGAALLLWQLRQVQHSEPKKAAILVWSLWLVLTTAIFSRTSGVIHPYYSLVLAPPVAALTGITVPYLVEAYRSRTDRSFLLPAMVVVCGVIAHMILDGAIGRWFLVGLYVMLVSLILGFLLVLPLVTGMKRFVPTLLVFAALLCVFTPVAFDLNSVRSVHIGSIPTAGPNPSALPTTNNEASSAEPALVHYLLKHQASARWIVAVDIANESAPIQLSSRQPVMAIGGFIGNDDVLTPARLTSLVRSGALRYYATDDYDSNRKALIKNGNKAVIAWLQAHRTRVSYGGSYYHLYSLHAN